MILVLNIGVTADKGAVTLCVAKAVVSAMRLGVSALIDALFMMSKVNMHVATCFYVGCEP